MKKIIVPILLFFSTIAYAQEGNALKSYEKFKFGVGAEAMSYPGYGISTQGTKFQLDLPLYKKLGASVSYVKQSSYRDFCDEVPVNVDEQHFVVGLNYVILDKSRWTIAVLGGFDIERTKYTEVEGFQVDLSQLSNEESILLEDHNSTEGFVEALVGLEIGYQLSDRFQLNYSMRLNSYGSFRNGLSLSYMFQLGKSRR